MRRLIGLACVFVVAAMSLGGALLATHDIHAIDLAHRHAPPDAIHWLGTDHLGRDLFARLAVGGWRAMSATALAAMIATAGGLALGLFAAFAPAPLRFLALRICDLAAIMPELVIAILVAAVAGFSPWSIAVGLGIGGAGSAAIMVHGLAVAALREPYVKAAEAMGAPAAGIAWRHVLPAVMPPVATSLAGHVGHIVLNYAALAFLGLGADSGTPDWGAMLFEYRFFLFDHPGLVLWPGLALLLFVGGLHFAIEPEPGLRRPFIPSAR